MKVVQMDVIYANIATRKAFKDVFNSTLKDRHSTVDSVSQAFVLVQTQISVNCGVLSAFCRKLQLMICLWKVNFSGISSHQAI